MGVCDRTTLLSYDRNAESIMINGKALFAGKYATLEYDYPLPSSASDRIPSKMNDTIVVIKTHNGIDLIAECSTSWPEERKIDENR